MTLPAGVSFEWWRISRRRGELVVCDGPKLIFHAETDYRRWTEEDVLWLLENVPTSAPGS